MNDHDLAAALATGAGELLLAIREELADASTDERKAAGDARSHDYLMKELAAARPDDAVLSEEGADAAARLSADRVWIVDPLDGTREFSEPERVDWAVHVALWAEGALAAGAVALPACVARSRTRPMTKWWSPASTTWWMSQSIQAIAPSMAGEPVVGAGFQSTPSNGSVMLLFEKFQHRAA